METVSGSVVAKSRKGFARLLIQMEAGDILIVTKLDRLKRNAMDVWATMEGLALTGEQVHCLALGSLDLTSPADKMRMGVINAVAEFERDLLIERTQAGLVRVKSQGKTQERPNSLTEAQAEAVRARFGACEAVAAIARALETSRQTNMRVRDAAVSV